MIDYEARYRALATENEDLREAAHAALILLGNLIWADPQVIPVIVALEDALDPEQEEEQEDMSEYYEVEE